MRLLALVLISFTALAAQEVGLDTWRTSGLGVDWHHASGRVAYDVKGDDGYYDIRLADPDGGNDRPLSELAPGLPRRHVATPGWHPSGRWLVAAVEEQDHAGGSYEAIPGFGAFNDIWAIAGDGSWAKRLTSIPDDIARGMIIPTFSADGRRLVWTERLIGPIWWDPKKQMGVWRVRVADVIEDAAGPRLTNIRSYQPGGEGFHEPYAFTPNGRGIIMATSIGQPSVWTLQIVVMDLASGQITQRLTQTNYNEHARFTPDGRSIVWMTNASSTLGGCDWWMMDADGANKRRLSYFNEPGHPHCDGHARWAGLMTFAPDGRSFLGGGQYDLFSQEGWIKRVTLLPNGTGTGLTGEYFAREDLRGADGGLEADLERLDATVDFNWGWWMPAFGLPADRFSVRWSGELEPAYSGVYTFHLTADDGARLWIDDRLVVDMWGGAWGGVASGTAPLVAGRRHAIRLEYRESWGAAVMKLEWSGARQVRQVIPTSRLHPREPAGAVRRLFGLPGGNG
ncbi:MAG: PD40 domain-containing protein [Planctomycetes bacterium]|nr:PD40 domain-containing protein [Planctomycetota bacterium]